MSDPLQALREYLEPLPAGEISETGILEDLLAVCWGKLDGGYEEGMNGGKLRGRMEDVHWDPPDLSFTIERHPQPVPLSTRAPLQRWSVDVEHATAGCDPRLSYRQVIRRASPVDTHRITEEIADIIIAGAEDSRLKWLEPGRKVRVNLSAAIPAGGSPKQTVEGRRRRLRERLIEAMAERGWARVGDRGAVFERKENPAEGETEPE